MSHIEFENGAFSVDAALIAEPLGLEPSIIQPYMHAGKITSVCERGVDDDAGTHRLTFFHQNQRLRLVIDDAGAIVERSVDVVASRGAPMSKRKR